MSNGLDGPSCLQGFIISRRQKEPLAKEELNILPMIFGKKSLFGGQNSITATNPAPSSHKINTAYGEEGPVSYE